MYRLTQILLTIIIIGISACGLQTEEPGQQTMSPFLEKLSDYGFFAGTLADLQPADGILPYDLNTPLFTDYAHKARFIKIPEGKTIDLKGEEMDFPVGTILIKNFYYPHDERQPESGRRIIETRLLIKEAAKWKVANYEWNEKQTEATRNILGGKKNVEWVDKDGRRQAIEYVIPDNNDCKGCHKSNGYVLPIGPRLRNLNRDFHYKEGLVNQLEKFQQIRWMSGLPDPEELSRLPVWDDAVNYDLASRARAYLDVNCAHCHTASGPANNTGLFLEYEQEDHYRLGFHKGPVSAAQGSGDLMYNVVPGNADASILAYRMNSAETGVAMPELGRSIIHKEGVALIREWINSL